MYVLTKTPLVPYVAELWVVISDDPNNDVKKLNKRFPGLKLQWEDTWAGWTNDHYYDDNVIAVLFSSTTTDINTIAHEAVHIVNLLFKHAGAKLDIDNDEQQAYYTGWVSELIFKANDKLKKKKKQL